MSAGLITRANGRLRDDQLATLSWTNRRLRADAAAALELLNAAWHAATGRHLIVNSAYRTLAEQGALTTGSPLPAGRSVHGEGLAVDLSTGGLGFSSALYRWLEDHAGAYGWSQPPSNREDGAYPEAWHWEFDPTAPITGEAMSVAIVRTAIAGLLAEANERSTPTGRALSNALRGIVWATPITRGGAAVPALQELADAKTLAGQALATAQATQAALAALPGVDADALAKTVATQVAAITAADVAAELTVTARED